MRSPFGSASLVFFAVLAARCTFPDVSLLASSEASGEDLPSDAGELSRDASQLVDSGLAEGGAAAADARSDGSLADLDATRAADADAAMSVEAGSSPVDAAPADATARSVDAAPLADAEAPSRDAAAVQDSGHDAGQKKQYPANVDCSSVDLGDCNSTIGFVDDPDCGGTGTLVQCGTSSTGKSNNGNGNGNGNDNGNDEASRDKQSCVILLQVTAVQTCL